MMLNRPNIANNSFVEPSRCCSSESYWVQIPGRTYLIKHCKQRSPPLLQLHKQVYRLDAMLETCGAPQDSNIAPRRHVGNTLLSIVVKCTHR